MIDDTETERYPFDYDAITYGSYISPDEIEKVSGGDRVKDFRGYQLKAMKIKDQLLRELFHRTGIIYTAKQEKDGIRILTPEEASEYNHIRVHNAIRQVVCAHHRNLAVDDSEFDDDQKKRHERRIECDSKLIAAIHQARKKPTLQPSKRSVPSTIGGLLPAN